MKMNEKKWLETVDQMPSMGMTRMLATHCHFGYYENNKLGLHISVDHAHMATKVFVQRLAEYLDTVFGRTTGLTIWTKENEDLDVLQTRKPADHQATASANDDSIKSVEGFAKYLSIELFDNGSTDLPMMYDVKCSVRRFIEKSCEEYLKE